MTEPDRVVVRSDWKNARATSMTPIAPPACVWTDDQLGTIRRGLLPRDMDHKWFAFMEADRLFLHRSWTGHAVYEVEFAHHADCWVIAQLLVTA